MKPIVQVSWALERADHITAGVRVFGVRRMATECKVTPQTISNWLAGTPVPEAHLATICRVLGFPAPMLTAQDVESTADAPARIVSWLDSVKQKDGTLRTVPAQVTAPKLKRGRPYKRRRVRRIRNGKVQPLRTKEINNDA
jgi:hypothetical protein